MRLHARKIAHTCFLSSSSTSFSIPSLQPLPTPLPPLHLPSSAESHYRNTISNTSAQVFDRLQTNLYSGGKQKAAEIYLLSVEERNKLAREPWVTSELTWRWISAPCKCMERGDILHSVIQHIAACRIPLTPTAGTPYFCVVRMQLEVVHYAELFCNYCRLKRHIGHFVQIKPYLRVGLRYQRLPMAWRLYEMEILLLLLLIDDNKDNDNNNNGNCNNNNNNNN